MVVEELWLRTGSRLMLSRAHMRHESLQSSHTSAPVPAAGDTAVTPIHNTNNTYWLQILALNQRRHRLRKFGAWFSIFDWQLRISDSKICRRKLILIHNYEDSVLHYSKTDNAQQGLMIIACTCTFNFAPKAEYNFAQFSNMCIFNKKSSDKKIAPIPPAMMILH